jgi:hypothetical protein
MRYGVLVCSKAKGAYAATLLWWVAIIAAFLAVLSLGRPRLPAALFVLAGMLFGTTHIVPIGPLGMVCLAAGAAWLEFAARRVETPAEKRMAQAEVAEQY